MNVRMATCHPDRPHLAKGLCSTCYESERAKTRIGNRWKEGAEGKRAKCHPTRRNFAHGLCKDCHHKEFLANNPDKKKEYYKNFREKWQGYMLKNKFNMTIEQYDEMLENQNGVCAICKKEENKGRRLSVDHNHDNGLIRGLLCQKCNSIIGMALDNVETLKSAIHYIERSKK